MYVPSTEFISAFRECRDRHIYAGDDCPIGIGNLPKLKAIEEWGRRATLLFDPANLGRGVPVMVDKIDIVAGGRVIFVECRCIVCPYFTAPEQREDLYSDDPAQGYYDYLDQIRSSLSLMSASTRCFDSLLLLGPISIEREPRYGDQDRGTWDTMSWLIKTSQIAVRLEKAEIVKYVVCPSDADVILLAGSSIDVELRSPDSSIYSLEEFTNKRKAK